MEETEEEGEMEETEEEGDMEEREEEGEMEEREEEGEMEERVKWSEICRYFAVIFPNKFLYTHSRVSAHRHTHLVFWWHTTWTLHGFLDPH